MHLILHKTRQLWGWGQGLLQIFIRHCGLYQFRGVPGQQGVFQISRGALEGRTFPPGPANPKKADVVGTARGLQAVLVLDPQDAKAMPRAA